MITRLATICTFAFLALATPSSAQGILYDMAPRPQSPDARATPRLVLVEHRVSGRIDSTTARYRVVERFRNPAPHPIEGVYLCPIPKGATARGIALIVDGKRMDGEILGAGTAAEVYRDIVRRMKDPALLEHVDDGLLRASVFPVPAHGCVDVEIDLEAPVADLGGGLLEIDLPLRHVREASAKVAIDLEVVAERRIDTLYSPTHAATIERESDQRARVKFDGSSGSGDFRLYFAADAERGALRVLTHRTGAGDGYFLLIHEPAAETAQHSSPRDVLFVVDRSGSMVGEKWEQAVKALKFGVSTLKDGDRFAIVSFATDVRRYPDSLAVANADSRRGAIEHLAELKPAGGTNISEALASALPLLDSSADRLPLLVFVTDGLPTVGETDVARIVQAATKSNTRATRIFTFGVGFDVNTVLLDRLAVDSRADSNYVAPTQDLEVPLSAFFAKVSDPALASPKLTIRGEGITIHGLEPTRLNDLFYGDSLRVAGRYSGAGVATITLEGTRGGAPVMVSREISLPKEDTRNSFLPANWAARRIGNLLTQIRLNGPQQELVDEVTALGKEHGIVTPYTSGLVVEDGAVPRDRLADARADVPGAGGTKNDDRFGSKGPTAGGGPQTPGGGPGRAAAGSASAPAASGEAAVSYSRELKKMSQGEHESTKQEAKDSAIRKIGMRTMERRGSTWIDSALTESQRATKTTILAFSDEYFAFVLAHKDLAEVLALGDDVIVVVDGKAIHIVPAT